MQFLKEASTHTFDSRTNRHLSRVGLSLDEQGWSELDELFEVTLDTTLEIQRRSSERQWESDESPIIARAMLMLFEMPPP